MGSLSQVGEGSAKTSTKLECRKNYTLMSGEGQTVILSMRTHKRRGTGAKRRCKGENYTPIGTQKNLALLRSTTSLFDGNSVGGGKRETRGEVQISNLSLLKVLMLRTVLKERKKTGKRDFLREFSKVEGVF